MSSIFRSGAFARPSVLALAPIAVVAAFQPGTAFAVEPFTIQDIRIEGVQRTDPGTVFASLPFRIGDAYNDEKGAAALRALFATGLFKDVRINIDDKAVVVVIEERPIIANVSFVGLHEFDTEALTKSLKEVGIGESKPFDRALADRAEQELKRQYLTKSYYASQVATTITPIERNRVNVVFTVTEGDPAKIGEIHIHGSKVFSESTLLGLMDRTETGWLTWYTKTDRYSRTALNGDLETIKSHYLNHGYLEFAVTGTQVTISPDKRRINLDIAVSEGQQYTVTAIKLEGEYFGREEDFKRLIALQPGKPYNGDLAAYTTRAFTDLFGTYGYAFAHVDARTDIDRATGQVVVTFVAEPARRVYVRKVLISGNSRTRDEVIRREFRQFESAWYDGQRIKASKARVERMGYFKEVTPDTQEVPGAPDQVDVMLKVEEKPTGNIQVGAGYSSQQRLSLSGSIQQDNVFGTGNYLGLSVSTAYTGRQLVLSTVDPYFTVDGVSRGVDVFYRTIKPFNTLGEQYELISHGASLRFGVPFSEMDTVFFGAGYESTAISTSHGLPNSYLLYSQEFGRVSKSFPLTIGWQRDSRDSIVSPMAGKYQRVNLELSPEGEARYMRANLQYQQFFQATNKITVMFNSELGWGEGLAGRPYPIFKNFYAGGLGSIRVFEAGTLGPVDVTGSYSGGNRRLNLNTEVYVPVPGGGNDKTFRLFGFVDGGGVWGPNAKLNWTTLESGSDMIRVSTGVGLSWVSPMGPLRLSYGTPIRKDQHDRIERFQFQIGTAF
ncbi:MAG: outer membrane protein assembly factor BamA [Paucibacter sp.]|nr:outer membrane protein assembly factor BamA [Roseateles sp.]